MGISPATVYRFIKEKTTTGGLKSPPLPQPRTPLIENLDDMDLGAIRRKVHMFYFKNELPTIDKVLEAVNADDSLPSFKRTTFYKLLQKLQFKYVKRSRKSGLIDREDIVLWRIRYLNTIRRLRNEGKTIYYTDETWLNEGHTMAKVWQDESIKSAKEAHRQGLSTGVKNPSGKGKRLIILHIGGVWSLRNVSISVPRAVLSGEGESAILRCSYDLEGAALYSIRWYRAENEFYRYVPREMPPTMVFPLPGASVDLAQSDHQQVRIVNMNRRLSGDYQCEVSADAPLFHTDIRYAPLTVVDPPFRAPQITISQTRFSRGDAIRANCSVDEAYPAPNITWILDEHKIAETVSWKSSDLDFKERAAFSQIEISILEAEHYKMGITYTSSSLSRVYHDHYGYDRTDSEDTELLRYSLVPPPTGQFSLYCVATIFDIYSRKSEPVYVKEDSPQPASVTGEDSAGAALISSVALSLASISLSLVFHL